MRKARFTDDQIIGILKEADQGKKIEAIAKFNLKSRRACRIFGLNRFTSGFGAQGLGQLNDFVGPNSAYVCYSTMQLDFKRSQEVGASIYCH